MSSLKYIEIRETGPSQMKYQFSVIRAINQ